MLQLSFLTYLWLAAGLVAGEDLTIYQRRFWHNGMYALLEQRYPVLAGDH
jgi:hypothetical protein